MNILRKAIVGVTYMSALIFFWVPAIAANSVAPSSAPAPKGPATEPDFQYKEETNELYQAGELPPFDVNAQRYRAVQSKLGLLQIGMFFDLQCDFGWPSIGGPFVLIPTHVPQKRKNVAYTVKILDRSDLLNPAFSSPESSLSLLPEFSSAGASGTFSRNGDRRIVLRGVDARYGSALVLRDGAPINDPFDGTVPWAALPREGLFRAEVVSGGGATAWGNGTTGGVVQFLTLPAKGQMVLEPGQPADGGPPDPNLKKQVIRPTGLLVVSGGEAGTREIDWVTSQPTAYGVVQLLGQVFSTDGSRLVAPEKAGPIDTAGWSHQRLVEGRWRRPITKNAEFILTVRNVEESHCAGTPTQSGGSGATFASVGIAGSHTGGPAWNALAYVQTGSAGNNFTAVNPARTAESPLIHEVTTPSNAVGASLTGVWRNDFDYRIIAGVDFRHVRGKTKADLEFENGVFNRERTAGGDQDFAGIFLFRERVFLKKFRATFGARLDAWSETDGHLREFNRTTGLFEQDAYSPAKNGVELNPSTGLVWQSGKNWRWSINTQRSYRRPTLAESYQTSGYNSVMIEPNPGLKVEHNTSAEMGIQYSVKRGAASAGRWVDDDKIPAWLTFGVTGFLNEIHDGIAIVETDGAAPWSNPPPPGYTFKKRVNVDRAKVQGVNLSADWRPSAMFSLSVSGLFNDAKIDRTSGSSGLVQRQMAGVSRSTYTLGLSWHPEKRLRLTARLRNSSGQFADLENTLRLGGATTLNLGASYFWTEHTEFYLTAENIADARVETDRTADGLIYLGSPRLILAGVRLKW